jgi:hypothetical protein
MSGGYPWCAKVPTDHSSGGLAATSPRSQSDIHTSRIETAIRRLVDGLDCSLHSGPGSLREGCGRAPALVRSLRAIGIADYLENIWWGSHPRLGPHRTHPRSFAKSFFFSF